MKPIKEKVTVYHCSKCETMVKETDNRCPKCNSFLINDGATKSKIIDREEYLKILNKKYPPFKLNKWYKWLFFIIGLLGWGNLIFWIIIGIVRYKSVYRYDKFYNPNVNKVIYIFGIVYMILFVCLISFSIVYIR